MARGTLIHTWLELIEWLDRGIPDESVLRRMVAQLADPHQSRRRTGSVSPVLARPAIQRTLSESSCLDPASFSLPSDIAAEITALSNKGSVRTTLYREWPFAVRLDDAIVQGKIDRLLLYHRGDTVDADSLLAADIVDFKTDAIDSAAVGTRTEFYRPQIEAYRRAVATVFGLEPCRITARLLFVEPGEMIVVQNVTQHAAR